MVTQVNGRFPDRGGSAAFAGASATIRKSNGTRGLTSFGVMRFASGPWKSKVRREPTPNTVTGGHK